MSPAVRSELIFLLLSYASLYEESMKASLDPTVAPQGEPLHSLIFRSLCTAATSTSSPLMTTV